MFIPDINISFSIENAIKWYQNVRIEVKQPDYPKDAIKLLIYYNEKLFSCVNEDEIGIDILLS